jgi:DNA-binding NarL/FixJ family response regulator
LSVDFCIIRVVDESGNLRKMIRILLVDDQAEMRRGLRMRLALEPDFEVVGEAQNGVDALRLTALLHPDIIILDLQMPVMDGVTAVEHLHAAYSSCAIVALSIYDDAQTQARAQAAGAAVFVSKRESPEGLPAMIRRALQV